MVFVGRRPASAVSIGFFLVALALAISPSIAFGQQVDPSLYNGLRWRQVGPFRAGRVTAVTGVPGNPAVYLMGTAGGGAWKTVDGGMVWKPIFDEQHVASIGAMAAAPSNPNIVYLGTGDVSNVGGAVNQGDGMWKSTDGGTTWTHIGLEDSRHIGSLWVDPKNPDIVFAAALGHTYAPNAERGIFKTTDGGQTWKKVLYKDDVTGAIDVAFAPDNPNIGFAATWVHLVKPDNPRAAIDAMSGAGLYKTTDGGETWTQVSGHGWPTGEHLGRIGVVVAPGGQRVFAIVADPREGGLYRSDDSGATWTKITQDPRVQGSGYFSRVFLDPQNPDIVYVGQTSLYRSQDGGKTFISYKGAPGGDDNHVLWIDPTNSNWMILGSDQGATVSMDGGHSWSSWYNQPTGQIYHLSVDNRFPYWIYGTQQDSGSVATLSRGDYGEVTFMDWDPIGGYEFGYIIPDPQNPNIVYAGGPARGLVKIDRTNRQIETVSPNVSRDGDYRMAVNPPLAFSPHDPRRLYEGTQFLLESGDAGVNWKAISPDLTKRPGTAADEEAKKKQEEEERAKQAQTKKAETREEEEAVHPPDRSALTAFALSPIKKGQIWAGTNNGLVQLTRDGGKSWQEVSPPGLTKYSELTSVEPSHFELGTAYVSVDDHSNNDFRPHIYRTSDFGKSWQELVSSIGERDFVKVVREDPVRKGLLYAGTENGTYVSFDNGERWNSLQLNLPTVSVRDMVVHGNDLVAGTYGRAFWILDDVTPLRQINQKVMQSKAHLFEPATAIRLRNDQNGDTPLPPEMPAGDNPPTGAVLYYYLQNQPTGEITLGVYDSAGALVRQFSSAPIAPSTELPPDVPDYWLYRPAALPKTPGTNRFVWDLRYTAPEVIRHSYPISALYEQTHPEPQAPFVIPGKYEVRLTVDGETYRQPLTVELDPRVKVGAKDLAQQLDLAKKVDAMVTLTYQLHGQSEKLHDEVAHRKLAVGNAQAQSTLAALKVFEAKLVKIEGQQQRGFGGGGKPKPTFMLLNSEYSALAEVVNGADAAPTPAMATAYHDYCKDLTGLSGQWNDFLAKDLPALNTQLTQSGQSAIPAPAAPLAVPACGP